MKAPRAIARLSQVFLLLLSASGAANAAITFTAQDARVFEGAAGAHPATFNVTASGTSGSSTFLLNVLAGGSGLTPPAVGGTSCSAGVDFITVTNQQFTVGPNGTFAIPLTICGNNVVDSRIFSGGASSDRDFRISLTPVEVPANSGLPLCGRCTAFVTIVDDDGTPSMSINSVSVSEPLQGTTRTATFTVSLHHPTSQEVRVNFTTRDGTARGRTTTSAFFDYLPKSGSLVFPAGALSGNIAVTIAGDNANEPNETFFVDLSAPVNATIAAGRGTGIGTIRDTSLSIGGFEVSPADAAVQVGEAVQYYVDWTVPEGQVWRDLHTIDFRIRGGNTALWVRWDEPSNLISLCEKTRDGNNDDDEDGLPRNVACTSGGLPGGTDILETDHARIRLAESSVLGSGPTGRDVTLGLLVEFLGSAAGHRYTVEVAATDDFGNVDRFEDAAEVEVIKPKKQKRR